MTTTILLNIAVFIALLLIVKKLTITSKVIMGLIAGAAFGVFLQSLYGVGSDEISNTLEWTNIIGSGFISLLQMITMPLIVVFMIRGLYKINDFKSLGKIGGLILGMLLITTLIASGIGVFVFQLFDLSASDAIMGQREIATGEFFKTRLANVAQMSAPSIITAHIPSNVFSDFGGNRSISNIATLVFSVLLAFAAHNTLSTQSEFEKTFKHSVKIFESVILKLLQIIIALSPYGIMALMAKAVATADMGQILPLIQFVAAAYAAIIIMFIIHSALLAFFGVNIKSYFKAAYSTLAAGATTHNTVSCIPMTINALHNKLGVSKPIATISATFGATNGQNACAGIYPTMLALLVAQATGVTIDFQFIMALMIVVTISAISIANFGGGWLNSILVVFPIMGLPVEAAALLIAVDPLIDMARSALNISGAMTSGIITDRILNKRTQ